MGNNNKRSCSCGAEIATDAPKYVKLCGDCFKKSKQQDKPEGSGSSAKKKSLEDYIPVHERLLLFWADYPNGRIHTEIIKWEGDTIVMKAELYRDINDSKPFAVGHAFEVIGSNPVNMTSALENAETSACGRATALAGYEIKKGIASREEMEKVQRHKAAAELPKEAQELAGEMDESLQADKKEDSRLLWVFLNNGSDQGFEKKYQEWYNAGYSDHQIHEFLNDIMIKKQKENTAG